VDANNDACGISVLVNETDGHGRRHDNVVRARAIFLDLDQLDDDGKRRGIPNFGRPRWPSAIVRTRRGYHCYWWLEDAQLDWETWEKVQRAMARKWGGDPHMVDRTKCLRIPGFWHLKDDPPVQMHLVHVDDGHWTIEELVQAFHLRLEDAAAPSSTPKSERPKWVRDAIAAMSQAERAAQYSDWVDRQPPAVSGQGGHAQLLKVIKMAWNYGVEWDQARPIAAAYNDRCQPPWDHRGFETQFDSASRSRFDHESWESQLWAPERESRRVEGPKRDEVPFPGGRTSSRNTVRREAEQPPEPPPYGADLPPPPDEPPWPVDDDAPGFDPDAKGESPSDPPGRAGAGEKSGGSGRGGGGRRGGSPSGGGPRQTTPGQILDKNAPLDSAKMFVAQNYVSGGVRTLRTFRGGWYGWSGGERYENYTDKRMNHELYEFSSNARAWGSTDKNGNPKLVPFNPTRSKINDMRHALESLVYVNDTNAPPCWIGESDEERPNPRDIVACANGLLHLPSGKFLGRRPDYFNHTALGVEWDPNAPSPDHWLAFLDQLWPDDPQSHALLQEWFGLCLVPDTSYQKALLIVGPKRSGKGTIAKIMNALHGAQNSVAWPSMTDLADDFGMQSLLDKTVAITPDLRVSGRMDVQQAIERFLQITGEDWVQVNRKGTSHIQAQIPVRFMLLSNLPPRLPDAGAAFASRVIALRLEQSFFGHEDLHLADRLKKELPGILLWAIEGWHRLKKRGYFLQPRTGSDLLEELQHLSNPLQAFVEERCELGPDFVTFTDELFLQWRKWCEEEGRSGVGEKSTFVRNMRAAYPTLRTTRPTNNDGKRLRALQGVRIRYDGDPEQQELPTTTSR
jgi:putative DNA primase/helicase